MLGTQTRALDDEFVDRPGRGPLHTGAHNSDVRTRICRSARRPRCRGSLSQEILVARMRPYAAFRALSCGTPGGTQIDLSAPYLPLFARGGDKPPSRTTSCDVR